MNHVHDFSPISVTHFIFYTHSNRRDFPLLNRFFLMGPAERKVMKQRVILESYDFGELCVNYAQTTPTFTNGHTQFLNSLDVFLN